MENIAVYILTNGNRTVLYVGVTRNLQRRLEQHVGAAQTQQGFTGKYKAHHLVYLEPHERLVDAIAREKQIKRWNRAKKEALINSQNPEWTFLEFEV